MKMTRKMAGTIVGVTVLGTALFTEGHAKAYYNPNIAYITHNGSIGACAGNSNSCVVTYTTYLGSAGANLGVTQTLATRYWDEVAVYCSSDASWHQQSGGWQGPYTQPYPNQGTQAIYCPNYTGATEGAGYAYYQ
jgi:hypothetical protein